MVIKLVKLISLWFTFILFFTVNVGAVNFTVGTDISELNESEALVLEVEVSDLSSCTTCYLQAAFKSVRNKYLGQTKNNLGSWYKYESEPAPSDIKNYYFSFQPVEGGWTGNIHAKIDKEDGDFKGSGEYYVKVKRFTGESSSGSWSNEVLVNIIAPSATPLPSNTPTKIPTNTATPKATSTSRPTPTLKKLPSITISKKISPIESLVVSKVEGGEIALSENIDESTRSTEETVLGIRESVITMSPSPEVVIEGVKKVTKILPITLIVCGFVILSGVVLNILKNSKKRYTIEHEED